MSGMKYLKSLDKAQLWRLFVDGRFQKKYRGWIGYEEGERGSVQALLNAMAFMIKNFDISSGLQCTYLRELHKVCMLNVETKNLKSSPGDIRYLNAGIPFFSKSTTYEHLQEVFEIRQGDGTIIFNTYQYAKQADELNVDEIYNALQEKGKLNYRNWYPNLDKDTLDAIEGKRTLHEFYNAKHYVQMSIISKMEDIVERYNTNMLKAKTEDEKLKVISLVSREMELLHPFPDGNARTFSCITLNHLLMFNGFPPALLENPNLDNEVSHGQWVEEIKNGINRTLSLIEDPNQKLFNYSILEMPQYHKQQFMVMAKETIKEIENYQEIYLNPSRLQRMTLGQWYNVNFNQSYNGIGDHNTFKSGNLYFLLDNKDWKVPKDRVNQLIDKGIKAFVTDDKVLAEQIMKPTLLVNNIKESYIKIASKVRKEVNPKTVLITGTEGKTGFKTQLNSLLQEQTKIHANINSANTEIPVLRSLINLHEDHTVEVNEVSVGNNESIRVERTQWVNPDICVITNVGPNHMNMHGSIENLIAAKASVVEGLRESGICILNADNEYFTSLLQELKRRKSNINYMTFGSSSNDTAQLLEQNYLPEKLGWHVKALIDGKHIEYFVPLIQEYFPLVSVGVLLTIKMLGYDIEKAAKKYELFKAYKTMGRLLKINRNDGDFLFYDQSRRGGISGMKSAFSDLRRIPRTGKTVALIGGISTTKDSEWTKTSHKELTELINYSEIDKIYTTGDYMDYVNNHIDKNRFIKHSNNYQELTVDLLSQLNTGDLLFVIGNAYLYLGKVSDFICNKYSWEHYNHQSSNPIIYENKFSNTQLLHDFKDSKQYTDINEFKTMKLMHFFENTIDVLTKKYSLKNVTSYFENSAYSETYCRRWLFNNTELKSERGKQLFGIYMDYGNPQYILHMQLATTNLHIGLIKCDKSSNSYSIKSFNETDEIYSREISFELVKRNWWPIWVSIDCGNIIELENNLSYQFINNFENSPIYLQKIMPFLRRLQENV